MKKILYIHASSVADAIGVSKFRNKDQIYHGEKKINNIPGLQIDLDINNKLRQASETTSIEECNTIQKKLIEEISKKTPDIESSRIKEFIEKTITVDRGIINESKIINEFSESKKIPITITNKSYYLNFNFDNACVKIGGKIDGFDEINNKIIEVKTRRFNFLGITDYEKIQLEIYMKMLNTKRATLIERYNNKDRINEYEHNPIVYDKIISGLQEYANYICEKYP